MYAYFGVVLFCFTIQDVYCLKHSICAWNMFLLLLLLLFEFLKLISLKTFLFCCYLPRLSHTVNHIIKVKLWPHPISTVKREQYHRGQSWSITYPFV